LILTEITHLAAAARWLMAVAPSSDTDENRHAFAVEDDGRALWRNFFCRGFDFACAGGAPIAYGFRNTDCRCD
jgi:hypothetical protein